VRNDLQPTADRHFSRVLLAAAALWFSVASGADCADVYSEESVKAAFVLRFTGYVTWPVAANPTAPVRIVVLDDEVMASRLQVLVENRSLGYRPYDVRNIHSLGELRDAHVLYIGARRDGTVGALPSSVRERGILTITAASNGLDAGAIINFQTVDRRVRFEVSMEAARHAGLGISSELLAAAIRVQGAQPATGEGRR
jgi:hypothetical protein